MRALLVLTVAVLLMPLYPVQSALACDVSQVFEPLVGLISGQVGDCLTEASTDPVSGDLSQTTTGGLLVQRAGDGSLSFTDGNQTWVLEQSDLVAGIAMVGAQTKPPAGPQAPIAEPPLAAPGRVVDGNATVPAPGAAPTELIAPDHPQVVGAGKPTAPQPVDSTAELPAQGTLNQPAQPAGDANGHAPSGPTTTGQQMPLTVDEMRAHGYLGIPRAPLPTPSAPNP